MELSIIIFALFFLLLFIVGLIAAIKRKQSANNTETVDDYFLAGRSLKWYLIAMSAGATANTGFIVTGAVGLGYQIGISAILLPLSWFVGDLFYWYIFPHRINNLARMQKAKTVPEFLTFDFDTGKKVISVVAGLVIIFAMSTYTIAQWVAASVTFTGFYNVSVSSGILISGILVTLYCIFGGFRSSVYADLIQGAFMLLLTTISIVYCLWAIGGWESLRQNETLVYTGYLNFFNGFTFWTALGFISGWAFAGLGFGLSQPHIIDKYFAGQSVSEVKKARWLYLFFVQYTWIGMTLLGVLIKYLIPNLQTTAEAESALSTMISQNSSQLLKGIVVCGVFATIASTADSLMIAIANSLRNDVLSNIFEFNFPKYFNQILTLIVAIITVGIAIALHQNSVFDLTVFAILLGATISPAMIVKIFDLKNNYLSLSLCIIAALGAALAWRALGFHNYLNQTVIGIVVGLVVNYLLYNFTKEPNLSEASDT